MSAIVVPVTVRSTADPSQQLRCDAIVDTGVRWLTLPMAWRDRLGPVPTIRTEQLETTDQRVMSGEVCGPLTIQIEGFRSIVSEVMFIEGRCDPLLGCVALQQSSAAADMLGHRLIAIPYVDAKPSGQHKREPSQATPAARSPSRPARGSRPCRRSAPSRRSGR